MSFVELRQALFGKDVDVGDSRILSRITVGVMAAWIAMGGDLLGSCVYGPDVLGRAAGGLRFVLLISTAATVGTLVLLAVAYMRMIAQFPHGGGGYTAAKHTVGERLALVSGVALVFDAALNVSVSVVTCVRAISDVVPATWHLPRMAIAVGLILALAVVNLRGVKASVAVLAPIVLLFVVSHLCILGAAAVHRFHELPAAVVAIPTEMRQSVAEHGTGGTLWKLLLAYALGGSIYTGMESVSNGLPVLREPKVRSARRTMLLLVGVPGVIIAAILVDYLVYDVRPAGTKTLNAVLFERFASDLGVSSKPFRFVLVTLPLLAEAVLLVQAAQTGFVDGPRILGALSTDRFVPRRFARLNGRLAPAPGILLIAAAAIGTALVARGGIEPLVVAFVIAVFTTFSISQWAMLRHAVRRRRSADPGWRVDAAVHGTALVLCGVILVGTIATHWKPSVVMLALIATATLVSLRIRRRYRAMTTAIEQMSEQLAPTAPRPEPAAATGAPLAVVVIFSQRSEFPQLALKWLERMPFQFSEIVLAGVSLVDAEAVEGEERLRQLESERRRALESVAEHARRRGWRITVELRRGADIIETAVELVMQVIHRRGTQAMVVGFRAGADASAIDPLLRDDDAVRLQTRLQQEKVPMTVVSIPLDA
ncbi:MAG: amino acid/polyamine/organocation transporter, superfamily [Myxococcales bacterium]|nr:amino acid/polyamine/organocation transporter, superfamily [Myxococcales bacterium]